MRILITLFIFIAAPNLRAQHNHELYNNGAAIVVQSGAEIHVKGDIHMIGGSLTNQGLILTHGNSYSNTSFHQQGTGTYRIENGLVNTGERQFISGSFAVRGGSASVGVDDGSFYNLELANDQGIVYLIGGGNVADVRNSVNFYTGSFNNTLVTHNIGMTGAITYPTNGSGYSSTFGVMNSTTGLNSFMNNTVSANGNMSAIDVGFVQGKLRRMIAPTGGVYNFLLGLEPAGAGAQRGLQYMQMDFDANNYDVITGYFESASTNAGTTTQDCAGAWMNYKGGVAHGEWVFNDISGSGNGTYDMTVWPQDDNFVASNNWVITKDNALSGIVNGCGPSPVGLSRYGFDGFSEFGLAAEIFVLSSNVLGINASVQGDNILVEWNVENENNVARYELERSWDGIQFEKINVINELNLLEYSLVDKNVQRNQEYFYRIKSINIDQTFDYSSIVRAKINPENQLLETSIIIFPNPSTTDFGIGVNSFKDQSFEISVLNSLGQIIHQEIKEFIKGNAIVNVNSVAWPSGVYIIQLRNQSTGKSILKKFIKQ